MRDVIGPVRKMLDASAQNYPDPATAVLYRRLMEEEFTKELHEAEVFTKALTDPSKDLSSLTPEQLDAAEAGEFDACLDSIWVIVGYMLARGWLIRSGWEEVVRSNLAKIDPETGVVLKREDGKYLKPDGWTPPNLEKFLK